MKGVERLLKKNLVQTAVYWANPVNDGYGAYTYSDPVEIKCRWEDKEQILTEGKNDEKTISRAIVFLNQPVNVNELLWLGSLTDLDSDQEENPQTINDIAIVKRPENTPALGSSSEFLYKAFLSPWLT